MNIPVYRLGFPLEVNLGEFELTGVGHALWVRMNGTWYKWDLIP